MAELSEATSKDPAVKTAGCITYQQLIRSCDGDVNKNKNNSVALAKLTEENESSAYHRKYEAARRTTRPREKYAALIESTDDSIICLTKKADIFS